MKKRRFHLSFRFLTNALVAALFSLSVAAQESFVKKTQTILLAETAVKVNIYEKNGAAITFFAPHYNEQTGTALVKELIAKNGGRLIEIESTDDNKNPSRYLQFRFRQKNYSLDPNRIFTENGRQCGGFSGELNTLIKNFADNLLHIIFLSEKNQLRGGEKFLVAVHNNADFDDPKKSVAAKAKDLTAAVFARRLESVGVEVFYAQADGVYLANTEEDLDNFLFLSTPKFLGFFAEKGFNTVVQKSPLKLRDKNCRVDDGSLSVFAGQLNIPYINIEADAQHGEFRQRQMIAAVYELLGDTEKSFSFSESSNPSEVTGK